MTNPTKVTEFNRTPGSVFVNLSPPQTAQNVLQTESYYREWATVASDLASDTPVEAPVEAVITEPPKDAKSVVLEALRESSLARSYDWIAEQTGLSPLTIHLACCELVDAGELECEASLTCKKFRLKYKDATEEVPPETPTAEELLEAYLPRHIESSRWFFYITPGAKSRVFDGTTFVYHNPSPPFWSLYRLAKGIFRNLGIRLAKPAGTWEAHIPIGVLTDQVFVESGLAGVEATIRRRTDDSIASKMSNEIRNRQLENTKRGMAKVKKMREGLVSDAAGVAAITAVSWFAYIVLGGVF